MRLGIVGSGKIVDELLSFIHEIKAIQLIHISGTLRSEEKLKTLCTKHSFQRYSTNYQDLLDDQEVDTIYIAHLQNKPYNIINMSLLKSH